MTRQRIWKLLDYVPFTKLGVCVRYYNATRT